MTANVSVKKVAALPFTILKGAASDPLITGALLWVLTRGPADLRARLLQPFQDNLLAKDGARRIARLIKTLRFLVVYGTLKRLNQAMNSLALNHWHLSSRGSAWQFGPAQSEVVVITGGCSGFGYEMVKGFAGKAKVVVIDVVELPKELAALPEVYFYKCDLSDLNNIGSCTSAIKNRHGNPTVLINNAGIANGLTNTVMNTNTQKLEKIFNVNLLSHFVLIREFLPGMLEARKGHVVTMASAASFNGHAGLVDYCCTKAGTLALHEGLRSELLMVHNGDHNIRTTIVHPYWHSTGIVAPYEKELKSRGLRLDPAVNVSNAVVRQVLSDRSGQLVIPEGQEHSKHIRSVPVWIRDIMTGHAFTLPPWLKF